MSRVQLRASKERIEAYKKAAAKQKMTLSEWFRKIGDAQLSKGVLKKLPEERRNIRKELR